MPIPTGEYELVDLPSDFEVSGTTPSAGWLELDKGEVIAYSLKIGDYVVNLNKTTGEITAIKNGTVALTPTMQIKEDAKNAALTLVSSQTGITEIKNIGENGETGWVSFIDNKIKRYSVRVTVSDKTFVVTDDNVYYDNTTATIKNASALETNDIASKENAIKEIIKYLADQYISGLTTPSEEGTTDVTASGYLQSGWVYYKQNTQTSQIELEDYALKYNVDNVEYYANYDKANNESVVETMGHNKPTNIRFTSGDKNTAGSAVTIGTEQFIVLIPENSAGYTTLLAKYNLKQSGSTYIQATSTSETTITTAFSGSNYWNGQIGTDTYPGAYCTSQSGTNCVYVYNSNSSVSSYVNEYVRNLITTYGLPEETTTGRIMKLEEANGLTTAQLTTGKTYWLGSAYHSTSVWAVLSPGSIFSYASYYNNTKGVRPVIVISTSDI